MARIDALTALGKKFGISHTTTDRNGTITAWLLKAPHVGHEAIIKTLAGTGYFVSGYGKVEKTNTYYVNLHAEKGVSE